MKRCNQYLLTLFLGLMSPAVIACNVIYGDEWAFISQAPEGWNGYCGEDAPPGTNLLMRPEGKTWEDTDAVLYVSVFDRSQADLAAFVHDEQTSFLAESPSARIAPLQLPGKARTGMIFTRIDDAHGDKYELAAYAEGPHA